MSPAAARVWWQKTPVERAAARGAGDADRRAGEEFTKKLVSLGYLTGPEAAAVDARPPERAGTETAGTFQNIATFLRARGKASEALAWYLRALEVNPKAPTVWFNYSVALMIVGREDDADDALLSAARCGYHDPEAAVYRRVAAYTERGQKNPKAAAQLVKFLRKQAKPQFDEEITKDRTESVSREDGGDETDPLYDEAARLVVREKMASISFLQRRMGVGFSRAGKLIDMMSRDGLLGPPRGSKPREVLVADVRHEAVVVVRGRREARFDDGQRVDVGDQPRLGRVRQVGVGQDRDGRAVLHSDAHGFERRLEARARRVRGDGRHRQLAVAAVQDGEQKSMKGLGQH